MNINLHNCIKIKGKEYNEIYTELQEWKNSIIRLFSSYNRCFVIIENIPNTLICIKIEDDGIINFLGFWDNNEEKGHIYLESQLQKRLIFNSTYTVKLIPEVSINKYNSTIFVNKEFDKYAKDIEDKSLSILKTLLSTEYYQNNSKNELIRKAVDLAHSLKKSSFETALNKIESKKYERYNRSNPFKT